MRAVPTLPVATLLFGIALAGAAPGISADPASTPPTPGIAVPPGPPATAAPEPEDPFDPGAFDSSVSAAAEAGKAAAATYLAGGTVLVEASASSTAGLGGYAASGDFAGKVFGKASVPDYGILYMSYNVYHAFAAARSGDAKAAGGAPDLFDASFALSELHFSFDLGKVLFVRLGNQLLAWGPSRIWSPTDFVNLERADPFRSVDLRAGKPGLKLHLPLESSNVFLFADFSRSVSDGAAGDLGKAAALAGRYELAAGGLEAGLSAWGGARDRGRLGLDLSGRALGTTIYGELAAAPPAGSRGAEWSASAGFERALGDLRDWTLSGEYFHQSAGAPDSSTYPASIAAGTFRPLYLGRDYAYLALSAKDRPVSRTKTTLSGTANLSDGSYAIKLSEAFELPRLLPFTLSVSFAGGGEAKEFTWYAGDRGLTLSAFALVSL